VLARALLPLLVLAAPLARGAPAQGDARRSSDEFQPVRSFGLPDSRAARAREASAEGHIAARRWSEALTDLQAMIEDQRGDVLPALRDPEKGGRASQQPSFCGAADRARHRLFSLPREAQDLYRERHENDADAALNLACARLDRRALAEVARRWPLTHAAERAWWALGDLELEIADTSEAVSAWRRALAYALNTIELPLRTPEQWESARRRVEKSDAHAAGILRRIDLALRFLAESEKPAAARASDGSETRGARLSSPLPPGRDADAWPAPFRLLGDHPFQGGDNLFLARSGDTLLVSTSMRLLALNAYSGALMWDSDEPPGWSALTVKRRHEFWAGIDARGAMIAPAAGARVALAALQIPITHSENADFQSTIPIMRIIPDRRLFAFDLVTGKKLWDHVPPPLWDGETGGFIERMSVAGPPVVVGTRVIAPFYRMQGRIDFHVGCFDVETGALLWSTSLVGGQRELNMFDRPLSEFCAPPVRVVDDRVIVLTQLGAVTCLDLFTGEIRWESTYEQIPLQANHDFNMRRPNYYWRNAPPVVTRDTVVCAPYDASDLMGFDLDTGSMLWSLTHSAISTTFGAIENDIDLLIGATDDTVYLGTNKIVALQAAGGLHAQVPNIPSWQFEDEEMRSSSSRPGRAVLFGDRVLVPTARKRIDVDILQGRSVASLAWQERRGLGEGSGGNLLVGPGEMFTISSGCVDGYFEWDVLVQRARRAFEQRPADPRCALELGQLLSNRGDGEWQKGQTENARVHLVDAQSVLEKGLANASGEGARPLKVELHFVLRRAARVRADLADSAGALRALRQAEDLAPDRERSRDTLLEELALLHNHDTPDRQAAWLRALDALEKSCADLTLVCASAPNDDGRTEAGMDPLRGFEPRFAPVIGNTAKPDAVPIEMPVGLWVAFERASNDAAAGDVAHLFAELHRILERYGDVELSSGSASDLASDAIGGLLANGKRDGYEVFEARAKALLDDATKRDDKDALSRVARLYPHSRAAGAATDALLTIAVDAGDAASVVRIAQSELSQHFRMAEAKARELHLCLAIAAVFKRTGNTELTNELVRTLGSLAPDAISDLPADGGQKLGVLARGIARWSAPESMTSAGRFAAPLDQRTQAVRGAYEFLGYARPESAPADGSAAASGTGSANGSAHANGNAHANEAARANGEGVCAIFASVPMRRAAAVIAFCENGELAAPLWSTELELSRLPGRLGASFWTRRAAFAAGRVVIAGDDSVLGLDAKDGSHAWEWHASGASPDSISIACASGVIVAVVHAPDEHYFVQALDAHSGTELWRESVQDSGLQPVPLVSSNQVVFVPLAGYKQFVVRDLFTGRRALQFDCEAPMSRSMEDDAWIEGDRLMLPWFNESRASVSNELLAIDLGNGRTLWRLGFGAEGGDRRTLTNVLQAGAKTYLLVTPAPDAERPNPSRSILELSTAIGATSPLSNVRVGWEDRILGVLPDSRARLSSSWIFLVSSTRPGARESRLRAVDLAGGEAWTQTLSNLSPSEIQRAQSQPAVSDTTVAVPLAVNPPPKSQGSAITQLFLFDRASGVSRGTYEPDGMQLIPLGKALFLRGRGAIEVWQ
jgi:outer membrane protein assembly factor BamB